MHRNKFGQQYYSLIGGGIDSGETPEQALVREVQEESGLTINNLRLVYVESAGNPYGIQYIFCADYVSGEVHLQAYTEEAKINQLGKNIYTPGWLTITDLPNVRFVSPELKEQLMHDLAAGFPTTVQKFSSNVMVMRPTTKEEEVNGSNE